MYCTDHADYVQDAAQTVSADGGPDRNAEPDSRPQTPHDVTYSLVLYRTGEETQDVVFLRLSDVHESISVGPCLQTDYKPSSIQAVERSCLNLACVDWTVVRRAAGGSAARSRAQRPLCAQLLM